MTENTIRRMVRRELQRYAMKEQTESPKSYSIKFAAWFTGTSLNRVKHPKYGNHQLTPQQVKSAPVAYKNKLFKAMKLAVENGDITPEHIKKNENSTSNKKSPTIICESVEVVSRGDKNFDKIAHAALARLVRKEMKTLTESRVKVTGDDELTHRDKALEVAKYFEKKYKSGRPLYFRNKALDRVVVRDLGGVVSFDFYAGTLELGTAVFDYERLRVKSTRSFFD